MKEATNTSPAPVGSMAGTFTDGTSVSCPVDRCVRDDAARAPGDDGQLDIATELSGGGVRIVGLGVAHGLEVVGHEDVDLRRVG